MDDKIDYNKLIQQAFREMLKGLLARVGEEGLPGEHHFVFVFDTRVPGVDMPGWMKAKYPEEMTIVMQHWFDNLAILDDRFAITLSFNGVGEPLVIPFNALKTFADPHAKFQLKFEPVFDEPEPQPETKPAKPEPGGVVSLDSFRKGS
ncbi:MAG: ClpXP protease specificity-enhancing factor SspB [Rhodobacteraceae bacterium]|nr:ClpXP protease specificity-enhancing factor SspB [Paracoccaceae bacterium]